MNKRLVATLCLAAGILYNSWPLGYVLDLQTARTGLASDLEVSGHPYYWLFILGDVITGVLSLLAAWLIWRRAAAFETNRSKVRSTAAMGLALFGIFTALCALVPLQHNIAAFLLFKTSSGTGFGLDGLTNGIAEIGILIALAAFVFRNLKWKSTATINLATTATAVVWVVGEIWFVIAAVNGGNAHPAQQTMLITTGLAVFVIGLNSVI